MISSNSYEENEKLKIKTERNKQQGKRERRVTKPVEV
jgi:hypothetical protein